MATDEKERETALVATELLFTEPGESGQSSTLKRSRKEQLPWFGLALKRSLFSGLGVCWPHSGPKHG